MPMIKKMHRCIYCKRPVYLDVHLEPDAPHHWECWQKAAEKALDEAHNRHIKLKEDSGMFKFKKFEQAKSLLLNQFDYDCAIEDDAFVIYNSDDEIIGEFETEHEFLDFCNDFWDLHKHNFMTEKEVVELEKGVN